MKPVHILQGPLFLNLLSEKQPALPIIARFMKTLGQFRKLKGTLCSDIKQRIICKLGRGPIIYYVSPCSPYFRSTVQQKSQFNGNFNQSQNFSELTCGVIGWNICGRSEFPSNWLSCTYLLCTCTCAHVHVCTCAVERTLGFTIKKMYWILDHISSVFSSFFFDISSCNMVTIIM